MARASIPGHLRCESISSWTSLWFGFSFNKNLATAILSIPGAYNPESTGPWESDQFVEWLREG